VVQKNKDMTLTKSYLKDLTYKINGACIEVHKALGPGLLESVYHKCLKRELTLRGIQYESEFIVPVHYKGIDIQAELRCDLLIENAIVVELKAVDAVLPIHQAQLMTYMKLLEKPKGMLVNFNVVNLYADGQQTFVNEWFRGLTD
jgi:GxxExxY protein